MKIEFFNKCSKNVLLKINNDEVFLMKPLEKKTVVSENTDTFTLRIQKEEASFFEKKGSHRGYKLTVETQYAFEPVGNEDISLTIVREVAHVAVNAYYDRLLLCEKPDNAHEYSTICNAEEMKSVYSKRYHLYSILVSPFENLTSFCLGALVLTLVFAVKINVLFSIAFFILAYLFIWILDKVTEKISDRFYKRVPNADDEKSEFEKIITDPYLNHFYNAGTRAFADDIVRDEL